MTRLKTLLILSFVIFASCTTNSEQVRPFVISGGKKIWIAFNERGAIAVKDKDVAIAFAGFMTDKDRSILTYRFAFNELNNVVPVHVRVEDVSEAQAEVLVDDAAPQLKEGRWSGFSEPKTKESPHLTWLQNDRDSVRIFRFTISLPEGREVVLHQALFFWGMLKSESRRAIGLRRPE